MKLPQAIKHSLPEAKTRGHRAFTLVEVMLALAIFSMVLISIYTTWSAIMRGSKLGMDAAASVQRCRVTVRALEDALNTAQYYAANDRLYGFVADTKGEFANLTMVARLPDTFPGSGFYGEPQRLRRVSFSVEAGNYSRNELVLRQWPLLAPENTEPYIIHLGRDVDLFKLDFWDTTKKEWVEEWVSTNTLPPLVRIAIGMGNKEGLPLDQREIITRVVAPLAIKVPPEYQIPGGFPMMPIRGATNVPPVVDPRNPYGVPPPGVPPF